MTTSAQELLVLRLKTLRSDVDKVRKAVTVAKGRDAQTRKVAEILGATAPPMKILAELGDLLSDLVDVVGDEVGLHDLIDEAKVGPNGVGLAKRLDAAPTQIQDVRTKLRGARDMLGQIHTGMVDLEDGTLRLESSLSQRCDELIEAIAELELAVADARGDPRALWQAFDAMLRDQAQPLFREYVEFLGGLTVRDTGLDDRVCEMTEVLLRLFTGVVSHFFPIPAAQAALSSAMDSVIKLGFPEWSIWGIPLVVHEVGVAWCNDKNEEGVQELLATWGGDGTVLTSSAAIELAADAFGAYTIGPAYGCAALLLRLQPQHDELPRPDDARDVDRARLILGILRENTMGREDSGFAEVVRSLSGLWRDAVTLLAGPAHQDQAERDLVGEDPAVDWLDDFQRDVVAVLDHKFEVVPFGAEQWAGVVARKQTLLSGPGTRLDVTPAVLLEVLNAVWAARLDSSEDSDVLANHVTELWGTRRRALGRRTP